MMYKKNKEKDFWNKYSWFLPVIAHRIFLYWIL